MARRCARALPHRSPFWLLAGGRFWPVLVGTRTQCVGPWCQARFCARPVRLQRWLPCRHGLQPSCHCAPLRALSRRDCDRTSSFVVASRSRATLLHACAAWPRGACARLVRSAWRAFATRRLCAVSRVVGEGLSRLCVRLNTNTLCFCPTTFCAFTQWKRTGKHNLSEHIRVGCGRSSRGVGSVSVLGYD